MLSTRTAAFIRRRFCQNVASAESRPPKLNPIQEYNKIIKMPRQERSKLASALYLIPVITFGLGTWQVFRRKEKLKLIQLLEERLNSEPIELPKDLRDLKDLEYRKIRVKGKFDHSKEIIIQPRARIDDLKPSGGLFSRGVQNGAWIITPFKLSDRNYSILINRGWVSKLRIPQENRKHSLIEDEVEIVGICRLNEKRNQFQMKNRPDLDLWTFRDIDAMAFSRNTAPVWLDATKECSMPGGPYGGQTRITLKNDHLNYIITWYSLCLLTFLLTRKYLKSKK